MRRPVLAGWLLALHNCLPQASKTSALTREWPLLAPPSDAGCTIRLVLVLPCCCCCGCCGCCGGRAACRCLALLGSSHGGANTAGGCSACMSPAWVPGLCRHSQAGVLGSAARRPCGHGLVGAWGAMAWGDGQQHSVHCSRSRIMAGGRLHSQGFEAGEPAPFFWQGAGHLG